VEALCDVDPVREGVYVNDSDTVSLTLRVREGEGVSEVLGWGLAEGRVEPDAEGLWESEPRVDAEAALVDMPEARPVAVTAAEGRAVPEGHSECCGEGLTEAVTLVEGE